MINVDLDKLESKRDSLRAELKVVELAIEMVKEHGVEQTQTITVTPIPVETAPEFLLSNVVNANGKKKRSFKQGLQKEMLTCLHTGPAKVEDLAKVIGADIAIVRTALATAERNKFVYPDQVGGKWNLSNEGKKRAIWFLQHPGYVHYQHGVK